MIDPYAAREKRQAAARQDGSVQPPANAGQRDLLMPALTSINNRIYSIEQKLERWEEVKRKLGSSSLPPDKTDKINECTAQLQDILTEYNTLHNQLLQKDRLDSTQLLTGNSLLQLNQQDIDYLEGGCGRVLAELTALPGSVTPATAGGNDAEIKAAFDGADYDRVITLYGQATVAPGVTLADETTFLYGQALLKNHQEALAHKVLVDLLARVRPQPGQDALMFPLMQIIADLDLAMESYDEARRQYEEIIKLSIERGYREEWAGLQLAALQPGSVTAVELKEFGTLLKNYLANTPKRDGYAVSEQAKKFLLTYPASQLVSSVNTLDKTAREQADSWLSQSVRRVEVQAGERNVQDSQMADQQMIAPDALPENGVVGNNGGLTPVPPVPAFDEKVLREDYDKGMQLLEAKEYEKALESFNKLLKTPYEEKALARIEEAAQLGAQEDRQKAADLFIRSDSTRNQETKKKLLLSSRQLLQGILVKYPQSGLADKVEKNLRRIEEELRRVDSSFLTTPPAQGATSVPPQI